MTPPQDRRKGHVYVVLAPATTEPEEQFIEVEDHEGRGLRVKSLFEDHEIARVGDALAVERYRLLEFPNPQPTFRNYPDATHRDLEIMTCYAKDNARERADDIQRMDEEIGVYRDALFAVQAIGCSGNVIDPANTHLKVTCLDMEVAPLCPACTAEFARLRYPKHVEYDEED